MDGDVAAVVCPVPSHGDLVAAGDAPRTAVDKALEVLAAFPAGGRSVGVTELADGLGLTKSTVFRLLGALERNGFVERGGGRYRLGGRLHELGARVYEPAPGALQETLAPYLVQLVEQTRETVQVGVLRGGEVVLLGRLRGRRSAPGVTRIGARFPAHCTALGKAMLAHDPAGTRDVVAAGLRPRTARTIVDPRLLHRELAAVCEEGLARSLGEARSELTCVAVALLDAAGRPVAALSVGGTTGRFDARGAGEALRRTAGAAAHALRSAQGGQ